MNQHCSRRFLGVLASWRSISFFLLLAYVHAARGQVSSSGLIGQALDAQVTDLTVHGGLMDVMKAVENQTGVHLEASQAVWDALPWGQDTTINIHVSNVTTRAALDAIARRLGLVYSLGSEAVELDPCPALARIGRRATLEEISALDLLGKMPAELANTTPTLKELLAAVDTQLNTAKAPYAVQQRGLSEQELARTIHVARNARMIDELEEIPGQTGATWYPWGRTIVVSPKIDVMRLLLARRLTRNFQDEDLSQILLDLAAYSNVKFNYAPGALAGANDKHMNFRLEGATVQDALEFISGKTGLRFETTDEGVNVTATK